LAYFLTARKLAHLVKERRVMEVSIFLRKEGEV